MNKEVYWRPYITNEKELVSICMQWFDEYDYDHSRYFNDTKYNTEEECQDLCDKVNYQLKIINTSIAELLEIEFTVKGINKFLDDMLFWKKLFEFKKPLQYSVFKFSPKMDKYRI